VNILLLGGYAFLGRAVIAAAQANGHAVSAFNRGNRPTMQGVEQITGDRSALALPGGRRWDAVIDTSGQAPRHVRLAAELLRDRVDRYLFVSSISVYPDPMPANVDETAPTASFTPGADIDDARDMENYGARKAACEAEVTEFFSGRDHVTDPDDVAGRELIIRPGFIVGPHDYSDRFNSWIERAARPSPFVIAPAPSVIAGVPPSVIPSLSRDSHSATTSEVVPRQARDDGGAARDDDGQPVQLIDVRDLAEWMIALLERGAGGTYNATGPELPMRLLDVAQTCIDATGGTGELLVVPSLELKSAGVVPWEHIPFWLEPEEDGIMQANIDRALAAGLRFRPLAETVRDTYAWLQSSDHQRRVVFPPDLEAAAISRFRAR
jgi:2'-hydroxyisoflavone reductase